MVLFSPTLYFERQQEPLYVQADVVTAIEYDVQLRKNPFTLQAEKVYVTNRLREQAEAVWRCIGENNGHFYVCGDAGMMRFNKHFQDVPKPVPKPVPEHETYQNFSVLKQSGHDSLDI